MKYVVVNYGLNHIYTVHPNAFIQVVEHVISKNSNVKLEDDVKVEINEKSSNVFIEFGYSIKAKSQLKEVSEKLITYINEEIKLLIGIEAENIKLIYKGRY